MRRRELEWSKIIVIASQYDARDFSKQPGKEECLWVNENKSVNKCACNGGNKYEVWKVSERFDSKDKEKMSVSERNGYARVSIGMRILRHNRASEKRLSPMEELCLVW